MGDFNLNYAGRDPNTMRPSILELNRMEYEANHRLQTGRRQRDEPYTYQRNAERRTTFSDELRQYRRNELARPNESHMRWPSGMTDSRRQIDRGQFTTNRHDPPEYDRRHRVPDEERRENTTNRHDPPEYDRRHRVPDEERRENTTNRHDPPEYDRRHRVPDEERRENTRKRDMNQLAYDHNIDLHRQRVELEKKAESERLEMQKQYQQSREGDLHIHTEKQESIRKNAELAAHQQRIHYEKREGDQKNALEDSQQRHRQTQQFVRNMQKENKETAKDHRLFENQSRHTIENLKRERDEEREYENREVMRMLKSNEEEKKRHQRTQEIRKQRDESVHHRNPTHPSYFKKGAVHEASVAKGLVPRPFDGGQSKSGKSRELPRESNDGPKTSAKEMDRTNSKPHRVAHSNSRKPLLESSDDSSDDPKTSAKEMDRTNSKPHRVAHSNSRKPLLESSDDSSDDPKTSAKEMDRTNSKPHRVAHSNSRKPLLESSDDSSDDPKTSAQKPDRAPNHAADSDVGPRDSNEDIGVKIKTEEMEEELFTIEKIIAKKYIGKILKYYIKWQDYDSSHDSWEPASTIEEDVPNMVLEYEQRHSKRTSKRSPLHPTKKVSTMSSKKDVYRSGSNIQLQSDSDSGEEYKPSISHEGSPSDSSDDASDGLHQDQNK